MTLRGWAFAVLIFAGVLACARLASVCALAIEKQAWFSCLEGDGCTVEWGGPADTDRHEYPDGQIGFRHRLHVTPERVPCTLRVSLSDKRHRKAWCVAVRADCKYSTCRPVNIEDDQRFVEVDLLGEGYPQVQGTDAKVGSTHTVLLFYQWRGRK